MPGVIGPDARFLALGDSYTIGEGVAEAERWPSQLVRLLRAGGLAIASPEIIATTGWTTDELAEAIQQSNPERPYGLVSLLIGVNNQYRGRALDEYREQFRALLGAAAGFAGTPEHVIVLSIPDWGVTPFAEGRDRAAIVAEIDAFNAVNREETVLGGANYVDITAISRRAGKEPALVAPDGLHPSGLMYREWAELVVPVAARILAGRP